MIIIISIISLKKALIETEECRMENGFYRRYEHQHPRAHPGLQLIKYYLKFIQKASYFFHYRFVKFLVLEIKLEISAFLRPRSFGDQVKATPSTPMFACQVLKPFHITILIPSKAPWRYHQNPPRPETTLGPPVIVLTRAA